jgi:hypothetical protein
MSDHIVCEDHDITCHAPNGCPTPCDEGICNKCEFNLCECAGCTAKREAAE